MMEDTARKKFETLTNFKVLNCGLFIDKDKPFLAASPDGLVGDTALLEIKCPLSTKDTIGIQVAVDNKKIPYITIVDEHWLHYDVVEFDKNFWRSKMETQLETFYKECLLPELVQPRYGKRLLKSDILEPKHILENIKKKESNYYINCFFIFV
ncbi:unnamed protein product [Macrosiphum euphorbiae]|uniref:YqaJ viral recombinase domain-containing protein n=1 Tax=Macrosiphum euphorbiae TaxID=13131 RepID=A0AAV0WV91_9HEMI|nr:unnamed protein product [Macrosiphum euphorbiae]